MRKEEERHVRGKAAADCVAVAAAACLCFAVRWYDRLFGKRKRKRERKRARSGRRKLRDERRRWSSEGLLFGLGDGRSVYRGGQ